MLIEYEGNEASNLVCRAVQEHFSFHLDCQRLGFKCKKKKKSVKTLICFLVLFFLLCIDAVIKGDISTFLLSIICLWFKYRDDKNRL